MSDKPKSHNLDLDELQTVDFEAAFIIAAEHHPAKAKEMINTLIARDFVQQEAMIKQFQSTFPSIPDALNQLFKENQNTKREFYLIELAGKISEFGKKNGLDCSQDYNAMLGVHHSLTESLKAYEALPDKTDKQFERFRVEWVSAIRVLRPILARSQSHSPQFFQSANNTKPANNTLLTQQASGLFEDEIDKIPSHEHSIK